MTKNKYKQIIKKLDDMSNKQKALKQGNITVMFQEMVYRKA